MLPGFVISNEPLIGFPLRIAVLNLGRAHPVPNLGWISEEFESRLDRLVHAGPESLALRIEPVLTLHTFCCSAFLSILLRPLSECLSSLHQGMVIAWRLGRIIDTVTIRALDQEQPCWVDSYPSKSKRFAHSEFVPEGLCRTQCIAKKP